MIWYDMLWYDMIWYDIFNRNWVDTRWQQYISHLHTNNIQNTEEMRIWEVQAMPGLYKLYPGICLTTEEKAWKNLSTHNMPPEDGQIMPKTCRDIEHQKSVSESEVCIKVVVLLHNQLTHYLDTIILRLSVHYNTIFLLSVTACYSCILFCCIVIHGYSTDISTRRQRSNRWNCFLVSSQCRIGGLWVR
jgi:hypothetical protein